ncbi:excalibur calcium-binding domain-containing protein [Streptomyces sp. NPDC006367]|uniref:excalibur calcium-binding domain-containing protein n=1 Tax=unclassified Streptomyces TaxID=2593676 RepID=UPI0033A71431
MKLFHKSAAVAVTAVALAALPTLAQAHDGSHPFKNCTEAYNAGYENIQKGDPHYGAHLDRDKDGVGCDNPPAGFVPADDKEAGGKEKDGDKEAGGGTEAGGAEEQGRSEDKPAAEKSADLAETGGDDSTMYLAAGGAAVALAGGGLLVVSRRRRATR